MSTFEQRHPLLHRGVKPLLVVLAIVALFWLVNPLKTDISQGTLRDLERVQVSFVGEELNLWIVDSPEGRRDGLSIASSLQGDEGMLFIFDHSGIYSFWMKDMRFPIDIFWLDQNQKIVFIKEHADPEDYPELYSPDKEARYVIETIAGFADTYDVQIGDKALFEIEKTEL